MIFFLHRVLKLGQFAYTGEEKVGKFDAGSNSKKEMTPS